MSKSVQTPGEAISVLIQVAELAQSKGILSFEDAIITKSAIDHLTELSKGPKQKVEGPQSEFEAATTEG